MKKITYLEGHPSQANCILTISTSDVQQNDLLDEYIDEFMSVAAEDGSLILPRDIANLETIE